MLRKLHNKKFQKKIYLFLAIVVIPSFIIWGAASSFNDNKDTETDIKLFGKAVSANDYQNALKASKNQILLQTGKEFNTTDDLVKQMAIERLVLLSDAKIQKIKVTDKDVIDFIQKIPIFWRKGSFDKEIYEQVVRYNFRTHTRIFEEQIRDNLLVSKLYEKITQNVKITDEEVLDGYKKENEEVSINYLGAFNENLAKNINPTDEQLKEFYKKNELDFKKPLTYNLNYLIIDTQDKVETIKPLLKDAQGFEKIAEKLNLTIKETGWFAQYDPVPGLGWIKQIPEILTSLKNNESLPIIKIKEEFYVLKLKGTKEPHIPEFEDIKPEVKEVYTGKEAIELAKNKIKEIYKSSPSTSNLEQLAKENNLVYATAENFKYGTYIKELGGSDVFFDTAKKLADNQVSIPIDNTKGSFLITKKSIKSIDEKKFEEEKEKFKEKLLDSKKMDYFGKIQEELFQKSQAK